jgi:hypothetical protein
LGDPLKEADHLMNHQPAATPATQGLPAAGLEALSSLVVMVVHADHHYDLAL